MRSSLLRSFQQIKSLKLSSPSLSALKKIPNYIEHNNSSKRFIFCSKVHCLENDL